jgi:hypothetical protein
MSYDYVFFMGGGHSGSTVLSAILYLHPEASLCHEWNLVGKLLLRGYTVDQVREKMLNPNKGVKRSNMILKAQRLSGWKDLDHSAKTRLLGDKSPWDIANTWNRRSKVDIFPELREKLDGNVKIIITVRDPYQHLPRYFKSKKYLDKYNGNTKEVIRKFLRYLAKTYEACDYAFKNAECLVIANEDLIAKPAKTIIQMCDFVDLPVDKEWRRLVQTLVHTEVKVTSYDYDADHRGMSLTDHVEERIIDRFEPLKRWSRR